MPGGGPDAGAGVAGAVRQGLNEIQNQSTKLAATAITQESTKAAEEAVRGGTFRMRDGLGLRSEVFNQRGYKLFIGKEANATNDFIRNAQLRNAGNPEGFEKETSDYIKGRLSAIPEGVLRDAVAEGFAAQQSVADIKVRQQENALVDAAATGELAAAMESQGNAIHESARQLGADNLATEALIENYQTLKLSAGPTMMDEAGNPIPLGMTEGVQTGRTRALMTPLQIQARESNMLSGLRIYDGIGQMEQAYKAGGLEQLKTFHKEWFDASYNGPQQEKDFVTSRANSWIRSLEAGQGGIDKVAKMEFQIEGAKTIQQADALAAALNNGDEVPEDEVQASMVSLYQQTQEGRAYGLPSSVIAANKGTDLLQAAQFANQVIQEFKGQPVALSRFQASEHPQVGSPTTMQERAVAKNVNAWLDKADSDIKRDPIAFAAEQNMNLPGGQIVPIDPLNPAPGALSARAVQARNVQDILNTGPRSILTVPENETVLGFLKSSEPTHEQKIELFQAYDAEMSGPEMGDWARSMESAGAPTMGVLASLASERSWDPAIKQIMADTFEGLEMLKAGRPGVPEDALFDIWRNAVKNLYGADQSAGITVFHAAKAAYVAQEDVNVREAGETRGVNATAWKRVIKQFTGPTVEANKSNIPMPRGWEKSNFETWRGTGVHDQLHERAAELPADEDLKLIAKKVDGGDAKLVAVGGVGNARLLAIEMPQKGGTMRQVRANDGSLFTLSMPVDAPYVSPRGTAQMDKAERGMAMTEQGVTTAIVPDEVTPARRMMGVERDLVSGAAEKGASFLKQLDETMIAVSTAIVDDEERASFLEEFGGKIRSHAQKWSQRMAEPARPPGAGGVRTNKPKGSR